MRDIQCPWCHQRFSGTTCPIDRWDSRYGNVKETCAHKGCRSAVVFRSIDPVRPVEYRTLWCDYHKPERVESIPDEAVPAVPKEEVK